MSSMCIQILQKVMKVTDTDSRMWLCVSKPVGHVLPTQRLGVCCSRALSLKPQPIRIRAQMHPAHVQCVCVCEQRRPSLRVTAPLLELQKPAVSRKCSKRAVKVVNALPLPLVGF